MNGDVSKSRKFEGRRKHSHALSFLSIATAIMTIAFVILVIVIDPDRAGVFGWAAVLGVFFLATVGFFSILSLLLWRAILGVQRANEHLGDVFREGVLFSFFALSLLALARNGWLFWWDGILVVGFFLLVEATIFSKRRKFPKEKGKMKMERAK